ncbi:L,D-transpeptidase [Gemmobacter aquarius]|uniref:L,D-transpeptidase n=1 Tax=Paragemmobacter aquarius TaxID=2169400 RepID=A0A2S0UJT3_9RHOB|nr:L,D-transpeptidase [Gemmobacter aquarius]AWB48066.1 L,D-transpeptidase [Gemmobacter aquarius]
MRPSFRLATAALAALFLSGCVPDQAMIDAGLAKPPEPKIEQGVYVSSMDGRFTLPAVPVEKVPPEFQRQTVYYPTDQAPGTIIIDTAARHLYLVTGKNMALRYGISVGKAGFEWSGEALITNRKEWPTWTPPPEMIDRKPELEKWKDGQPGGLENPLGARALYLTTNGIDYGYRIHGTPEWFSIGRNASSGCIRMINQDVIDLYARVQDGAKVIVLNRDGSIPTKLTLPPPAPKKPKPAATPAPVPAAMPAFKPGLTGVPPALIVPPPATTN